METWIHKPIKYWVPSIATSAIAIYKGEKFKEWNGDALITSLRDEFEKIQLKVTNLLTKKLFSKGKLEELGYKDT